MDQDPLSSNDVIGQVSITLRTINDTYLYILTILRLALTYLLTYLGRLQIGRGGGNRFRGNQPHAEVQS